MKTISFAAYETIAYSISNLDLGPYDYETAAKLVKEGKSRWALCHGGILTLVPNNYQLKMWEHFLQQTSTVFYG